MIRFACPGCNATYSVDDAKGGKTGKCPKCQTQFLIPEAQGGGSAGPASASLPPPPPINPNEPVEINPCPGCQARLSVTGADLGADVECPYCKKVYKAVKSGAAPTVPPTPPARLSELERPTGRNRRDDDDEDDRPSRRRRRDEDEDEDEDDRPSRRRSRDDDDDRPRTKKRRRRGDYEPHRGTLILILGILGFIGCGIFTAIPAWILGNNDLRAMDAGRMDPEGRSLTQVGKILGMVSVILTVVVMLIYCVIIMFAIGAGAAAGK